MYVPIEHKRLVEIAQSDYPHALGLEVRAMARELLASRTRIEMLKMDLERAIRLAENLQNGR